MGNSQQPLQAPNSYLKTPSASKMAESKLHQLPGKSSIKVSKIKKDTPEFIALKKQKSFVALSKSKGHLEIEEYVEYEGFKLAKTAHLNKVEKRTREENYSVESQELRETHLVGTTHDLSLTIDDTDGVSEQAQIYTFDYERSLNHFIRWDRDMNVSQVK